MNELVPNETLQQLDQRQEQVLAELDSLNERLEQALGSFGKASESVEPAGRKRVRSPWSVVRCN